MTDVRHQLAAAFVALARAIRRAAETVAKTMRGFAPAVVLAYREFVIDRARDDIRYTTWRARRSYRITWEPRRRHRWRW